MALLVEAALPPQTGGAEMFMVDKSTMSGRDMRTYRCDHCQEEHIVDYGIALWKAMSGQFDD
jgi:hypothetical protein